MAKTEEKIEKERKWLGVVVLVVYAALFVALIYSNYSCKKNHEQLTNIISECINEGGKVAGFNLKESMYVVECEGEGYVQEIRAIDKTFS